MNPILPCDFQKTIVSTTRSLAIATLCGVLIGAPFPATGTGHAASEPNACQQFVWPLETERSWFKAADSKDAETGETLATPPNDRAITVKLAPAESVALPAPPTGTPKSDHSPRFAGVVNFKSIPEADYQIALSDNGWIDVVQNGKALEATGHTGAPDCADIRKSVRFEIASAPFAIQITGARAATVRIAIRPAAD